MVGCLEKRTVIYLYIKNTSRLKVRRVKLGLTRDQVAGYFNVTTPTIAYWEYKESPEHRVVELERYYKGLENE